jgi:hypothetical protein
MAKAYRNFLRDVPYQFFIINRVGESEQWLRYLRQKFPDAVPSDVTLAEYAVERATENAGSGSQVKVIGLLRAFVAQSCSAVIDGNKDEARGYMQRAQELWTAYTERNKASERRLALPSLDELKVIVLKDLLRPDSGLSREDRAALLTEFPGAAQLVPQNPPEAK